MWKNYPKCSAEKGIENVKQILKHLGGVINIYSEYRKERVE